MEANYSNSSAGGTMSRSGYSDDLEILSLGRWRGQVASAIRGKRGQALLRETLAALDVMPVKELITNELEFAGQFCTLGVVGAARGIDMQGLDPEEYNWVAEKFDIAHQLVQEIVYLNDECGQDETSAQRWVRMRQWVASEIISAAPEAL